jgi:hypothetical protein
MSVGSDAHLKSELGKTYMEIEDFDSKKEFVMNLKKARFRTRAGPIWVHAVTKFLKTIR